MKGLPPTITPEYSGQVQVRQGSGLQPDAPELFRCQPAVPEVGGILVLGGGIFGPGGQEQERLHTLSVPGAPAQRQ